MKKECENKLSIAAAMEANGNAANNRLAKEYVAPDTRRTRIETEGTFCGSTFSEDPEEQAGIQVANQRMGNTSDYHTATFDENGERTNGWDF